MILPFFNSLKPHGREASVSKTRFKTLDWAFPGFKNIHLNPKKKKKKWLLFFVSQKDMTGLRMFFLVPETMSTSLTSNNKYHYVTGLSLSSA